MGRAKVRMNLRTTAIRLILILRCRIMAVLGRSAASCRDSDRTGTLVSVVRRLL
jgi:hypothetical protein